MISPRRSLFEFARIDCAHLCDGLFVLTQGHEGRGRNRIVETTWGDFRIKFACVEPLGDSETSVLLALVARAGVGGKMISAAGTTERSRSLHTTLQCTDSISARDGVMVSVTIKQLIEEINISDAGSAYKTVTKALERLGNVVVWVTDTTTGASGNSLLLSVSRHNECLDIAMNCRIREALKSSGFTRVSLIERRALTTPTARMIHTFLSRWLPEGCVGRKVGLDTLALHIWTDGVGEGKNRRYHRRQLLLAAMVEIGALGGWDIAIRGVQLIITRREHEKSMNRSTRKPATLDEKTQDQEHEKTRDRSTRKPATLDEKTRDHRRGRADGKAA